MNSVVEQLIRCIIHEINDMKNWLEIFPTIELAMNSVSYCNTGYTPFFLNCGYDVTVHLDLVGGDEIVRQELVGQFCNRLKHTWGVVVKRMKQAMELQSKYYDSKHKLVNFEVGGLFFLNTVNLRMKQRIN